MLLYRSNDRLCQWLCVFFLNDGLEWEMVDMVCGGKREGGKRE